MRPAARGWEDDYSQRMEDAGMKRGKAASTTYYNAATGTRCVVHGDDFTFMGPSRDLARMRGLMEEWYQIKVRAILGDGPEDDKEITLLNRIVRWRADFVEVQADAKHQRLILECFGLDASSNALASPSVKVDVDRAGDGELEKGEATNFRAIAARANYLAADRADLQYAVKEACRGMATPLASDVSKMKRIARYLVGVPALKMRSGPESYDDDKIIAYVDSDWAGCRKTRRSTSGGMLVVGGMLVRSWSSTQAVVATSSGEAEYYALVRGSAEAIGLQSILGELGWDLKVEVRVDSSAAKAISSRVGLGKTRHVEVKFLWVQDAVRAKRIKIMKVLGTLNPADILTKPKSHTEMNTLLKIVGSSLELDKQ